MNTSGKTYDIQEFSRLNATLNEQQEEMEKIDNDKSVQTVKIIQYAMLFTGALLSLYMFSRLVNKKK
jgi:hypothetical protein